MYIIRACLALPAPALPPIGEFKKKTLNQFDHLDSWHNLV